MKRFTSLSTLLLALLSIIALVSIFFLDGLVIRWFEQDVIVRSRLIFNSTRPSISSFAQGSLNADLEALFNRISEDERVLGLALCNAKDEMIVKSRAWPMVMSCDIKAGNHDTVAGPIFVSSFQLPLNDRNPNRVLVAHDIAYIKIRSLTAKFYLLLALLVVGSIAVTAAVVSVRIRVKEWVTSIKAGLISGQLHIDLDPAAAIEIAEIRRMIRELERPMPTTSSFDSHWTSEKLKQLVERELSGSQIIVVSNREPYIHNYEADRSIKINRPASGVVTALEPIVRACTGVWIAHGSGSADRDVVDEFDRIIVPPENPSYYLRRLWLSEEEEKKYYSGLSNEGLWPLCHSTFVRPVFRESDWETYVKINQRFAETVISEAKDREPVILVQDYHLALVPRMIRAALPDAIIITFWHIPWPNSEIFGICPWREQLIEGLLGSSVLGFHTQLHCNNFIDTVDRYIASHIDRETAIISKNENSTAVRPYPISVAWPENADKRSSEQDCRKKVIHQYGLNDDAILALGVERFDFTKGIPDRFRAIEILLEKHSELQGRFVLIQIAAPTRDELPSYQSLKSEAEEIAARVNKRFSIGEYRPIILVNKHYESQAINELFRAADACIVSSLHDGMNLVAKEFVAARDDELGVLVLSAFAGASRELAEALIVNPFDARATADALYLALKMPREEQIQRMRAMRAFVREHNVFYWAGRMLLDSTRIWKRKKLTQLFSCGAHGR